MRKKFTLILLLILVLISPVGAQQIQKNNFNFFDNTHNQLVQKRSLETDLPEREIHTWWNESIEDWDKESDTAVNKYSNNGLLMERAFHRTWSKQLNQYTYDGSGRELSNLGLSDYSGSGSWDTSNLDVTVYDAKGLPSKVIYYYGWYAGAWEDSTVNRYSHVMDGNGRIAEQIAETWDEIEGFVKEQKIIFSYGKDNKINLLELYNWNDSLNAFELRIQYDSIAWHSYVENDAFLEKSKPTYVSGTWNMDGNKTFVVINMNYDAADNLIQQVMSMSEDGIDWIDDIGELNEYQYDSKGRCIEYLELDYDDSIEDYIPRKRVTFSNFYTAPNLDIKTDNYNNLVYPNPAKTIINVPKTILDITIINTHGQIVLNNASIINNQIDISGLHSGIYIVQSTLNNGETRTEKLLIQ